MYYTIYKITNTINNKIYIGKHQTKNPNDAYYGSGKAIANAIKLHGKDKFIKELLFIFDNELEMNTKEKELITEEFVSRHDTYNLGVGGEGGPQFKGKIPSQDHRDKISKANKGRIVSPETRLKLSKSQKGKVLSDNHKEKIKISAINRRLSEETKLKISNSLKGKSHSDETKEKMRLAKLGKKREITSDETKLKLSIKAKESWNKRKSIQLN